MTVVARHATPRELHDRHTARTGTRIDSFPPAVQLDFLDRRSARLTVSSFYEGLLPKDAGGFDAAFARAFRAVADSGVTDLVVDVRGNEGGNGQLPPLLYRYLAARPFRTPGRAVVAGPSLSWLRYAADPSDEIRAFAAAPRDFLDRTPDGLWTLKPQFDSTRLQKYAPRAPRDGHYAGRLYVLTDGGSFSAANGFVGLALAGRREAGRAVTFVGEEPGGDHAADRGSGGVQQALVLPNTGERLTLALTGGVPELGAPAARTTAGVTLPDVRVQPDGRDIAAGTDRVLEATRGLIARARDAAATDAARRLGRR